MTTRLLAVLTTVAAIGLSSCAIKPIPLTTDEVRSRAKEDRAVLTMDQEPVSGPIDLYEAMARALKYNLDARVELMHKMLAQTQLDLAHYAMLPRLAANAGFDGRSNYTGGTALSLLTFQPVTAPFTSSEKNVFSADLSLSWNVLDFGMSYIRAKQAADDVLIAEEERRRVANRVMQDVRAAYWRAVSAERILPSLKMLDEWVKSALEKAQAVQEEKLSSPLVPLQYKLDLLNTQRYIQQLFRDLSTAKLQLAALMNLPPGQEQEMMLMVPEREARTLNLPLDMTVLENRALEARPELRMIDYRRRINARETKAAILEMLPSLNLQAGGNYSSNSFLFNNNWAAYAARASWNLLNIFRYPARAKTIEAQDKVLHTQNLALTMAIDAKLLVLDEPTLGLDILARRAFYDALVNDYMDETRTILITTHQVEEVENLLTDIIFIDKGRIVMDTSLEDVATRFTAVAVTSDRLDAARAEKPFYERHILGKVVLYFENADPGKLGGLGEIHTPSVSDLFVAKLSGAAA